MRIARRPTKTALVLITVLTACTDGPPAAPPDIEVRVMNPVAWAGTSFVLVSPGFGALTTLPAITLDDSTLAVSLVDDSTISVRAPAVGGTYQLRVHTTSQILSGTVEVAGYLATRRTIPLGGWPLPISPGSPVMLAAAETTLVMVNLSTGIATPLAIPHRQDCLLSPGPSFRSNAVVAAGWSNQGCLSASSWTWLGTPAIADSGPGVDGSYLVAELSPGTWLRTGSHSMTLIKDGVTVLTQRMEEMERVVLSPDRGRVVLLPLSSPMAGGVPVLDAALGAVAFFLPLTGADAAVYTPAGDTLFLLSRLRLFAVSPASGQVLVDVDVTVPADVHELFDLILDPRGRWMYALAYGRPLIVVLDRGSLTSVATLSAPCPPSTCWGQIVLGVDPNQQRLHGLMAPGWQSPPGSVSIDSHIFDFSLPPVTQTPLTLEP